MVRIVLGIIVLIVGVVFFIGVGKDMIGNRGFGNNLMEIIDGVILTGYMFLLPAGLLIYFGRKSRQQEQDDVSEKSHKKNAKPFYLLTGGQMSQESDMVGGTITTTTNYALTISEEYGGILSFLYIRLAGESPWVASILLYIFPAVLRFVVQILLETYQQPYPAYYRGAAEDTFMVYIIILAILFPFVIMPIKRALIGKYDYDKIYMVSYNRDKVLRMSEKLSG